MRWTLALALLTLTACGRGVPERYRFLEGGSVAYRDMPAIRAALPFERIQLAQYSPWLFGGETITLWRDGRAEWTGRGRSRGDLRGEVSLHDFGSLCYAIERLDLEGMQSSYDWGGFDALEITVRAWRSAQGPALEVADTGNAGPIALWTIQTAIEGVAGRVDWEASVAEDASSER